MKFLHILLFLFTLSTVFAECSGSSWYYIPAVLGQSDGGLVNVSVQIIDGNGDIYVSTTPYTGIGTQESAITAIDLAFDKSGEEREKCDVLVKIGKVESAEYVDGPSAGVALTVITHSALERLPIRNDSSITGAVDEDGFVTPIGGLYEKARAVARNGYDYFVTPLISLHERVLLVPIKEMYGLRIIEVERADEAMDFFLYNKTIEQENFTSEKKELPENISDYPHPPPENFRELTEKMIELENLSVQLIPNHSDEMSEIKKHFVYDIERQEELVEKGYLFSAANEAFLDYIDASTIVNARRIDTINLNEKVFEIELCLDSLSPHEKRIGTYEWLIGADIREAWSKDRLETIDVEDADLAEIKYIYFNELMYADAWCRISKFMEEAGEGGQEKINESVWKEIAEERITEAKNLNTTENEWERHLRCSENLFEEGKYGASAYDATFALAMSEADVLIENISEENLELINNGLSAEQRTSLWGNIYQTQGVFLHESGDERNAYRILYYSKSIDELQSEMNTTLHESDSAIAEENGFESCATELMLVFLTFFIVIFKNV